MTTKKAKAKPAGKPRQARLPGTEDNRIEALEAAAEKYVEIRDRRIALSADEIPLKQDLIARMKANHRTKYRRDGFEIDLVMEKENVKVRIVKDTGDE